MQRDVHPPKLTCIDQILKNNDPFSYGNVGYLCQVSEAISGHHLACVSLFFHLVDFKKQEPLFPGTLT